MNNDMHAISAKKRIAVLLVFVEILLNEHTSHYRRSVAIRYLRDALDAWRYATPKETIVHINTADDILQYLDEHQITHSDVKIMLQYFVTVLKMCLGEIEESLIEKPNTTPTDLGDIPF